MSLAAPVLGFRPRDGFPQHGAFAKPTSVQVAHSSRNRARNLWNYSKIYFRNFKKITLTCAEIFLHGQRLEPQIQTLEVTLKMA